jgi:hypothetical protein
MGVLVIFYKLLRMLKEVALRQLRQIKQLHDHPDQPPQQKTHLHTNQSVTHHLPSDPNFIIAIENS